MGTLVVCYVDRPWARKSPLLNGCHLGWGRLEGGRCSRCWCRRRRPRTRVWGALEHASRGEHSVHYTLRQASVAR
jgi:hypothetical protein